jgi:hypothetical protein
MMGIVTGELTCHLTGENTHRREVGCYFTSNGVDINRGSSKWALRSLARAMIRVMCPSNRRKHWKPNHVRPIA